MKYISKFQSARNSSGTNECRLNLDLNAHIATSYGHYIYGFFMDNILYMVENNYSKTTARHKYELIKYLRPKTIILLNEAVNIGLTMDFIKTII